LFHKDVAPKFANISEYMSSRLYLWRMQNHAIIPFSSRNYPELITVWEASVRATHHFLNEADIQHYKPLILDQYFDQVILYGLKDLDNIAGFIGINGKLIQMLFIHPDYRGKGMGKSLIDYAIGMHQVDSVDVNEENLQAVGFYQHLGFVVEERYEEDAAGKPYPILSMRK